MAKQNGIEYQPEISLALQRVIQRAALHAQSSGKEQILGINILAAMYQEKESFAIYLLRNQGVERLDILECIAHDEDRSINNGDYEDSDLNGKIEIDEKIDRSKVKKKSLLQEFAVNINLLAQQGKIDPLIGRENEVSRVVQVFCRRRKNNPLLVGNAGVGKTAIAEGLAWAIVNKSIPEPLNDGIIYSLDIASLLAGTKFRGDFEQRFKGLIKELIKLRELGKNPILFIDEFHMMMGAGATAGGSLDASNLLKPYLNMGLIRCFGSTTYEEYRKFIEKDSALDRRFQKIDILEPSKQDTLKILQGIKQKFETHHKVDYSLRVLRSIIDLSEKHLRDRSFPDKAIDLMDEVGALLQMIPGRKRKNVRINDVEEVIARMGNVPKETVKGSEKDRLLNLSNNLKLLIFGQDYAIDQVVSTVCLSRSGLRDNFRPMGNFLFAGPTGVGKTELAKQLAFSLNINFERFDMSEYMEKHSVSKLIGSPPGYVGHEEGGVLTDRIKKHPYTVLLLDEIEKAHFDIFNILLQVMDHGVLTDSHGRVTCFKNVILIMTTNAGAANFEAGSIGLGKEQNVNNFSKRDSAIKSCFSPEFRNRLDNIINFNKLSNELVISVVDKFIGELESRLTAKKIFLDVSLEVKKWIAVNGFDEKMGARPIKRMIEDKIIKPLSKKILFEEQLKGKKIYISLSKDQNIEFNYKK